MGRGRHARQAYEELHQYTDALKDLHTLINTSSGAAGARPKNKQQRAAVKAATRVRDKVRALQHDKGTIMSNLLRQLSDAGTDSVGTAGSAPTSVTSGGSAAAGGGGTGPDTLLGRLLGLLHDDEFVTHFIAKGGPAAVWPLFKHNPRCLASLAHICSRAAPLQRVVDAVPVADVVELVQVGAPSFARVSCSPAADPCAGLPWHWMQDVDASIETRCAAVGLLTAIATHMLTFKLAGADPAISAAMAAAEYVLSDNSRPARFLVVALQVVMRCCVTDTLAREAMRNTMARRVLSACARPEDEVREAGSLAMARVYGSYVSETELETDAMRLLRPILMSDR